MPFAITALSLLLAGTLSVGGEPPSEQTIVSDAKPAIAKQKTVSLKTLRPKAPRKSEVSSVEEEKTGGTIPTGDVWHQLAVCESGADPTKNTGNGFYGMFQFSAPTWNSMGTAYSRADLAPASVQLSAAKQLQARSGWLQWPACSAKLGLS